MIRDQRGLAALLDRGQPQRDRPHAIAKKAAALAQRDGEDEQAVLVNEVVLHQLLNETVAAGDDQILRIPARFDSVDQTTAQELGIVPVIDPSPLACRIE